MNKKLFLFFIISAIACLIFNVSVGYTADVKIGVAWIGKSGMTNRVVSGLQEVLKTFDDSIEIEYQKELDSAESLAEIVKKWTTDKDGMVILRSNGAKWLIDNPPTIPTFIGGCNNPEQLGLLKDMNAPDGNITGVTYFLPVSTQFETFQAIVTDLKSVLLLLEEGHPGSIVDQDGTKAICEKLGIEYNEIFNKTKEDIFSAVEKFKGKVSTIIIGSEALIMDNAAAIVEAAGATPVLAYSSKPVKVGALGGFVADDEKLGEALAESIIDVLINGKAIKEVPVKVDPNPKFYINVTTAEKIDIKIPYEILEMSTIIE